MISNRYKFRLFFRTCNIFFDFFARARTKTVVFDVIKIREKMIISIKKSLFH